MNDIMLLKISLTLCLLLLPVECDFMINSPRVDPQNTKGFELIEGVLVSMAKSFPVELFLDDAQLIQVVDRRSMKQTEYRNIKKKDDGSEMEGDQVVYGREANDENREVVVVQRTEDRLPVYKDKRVFVVLKKDPRMKVASLYFGNYVYARLATDSDVICNMTSVNERVCFEWDIWDGNRVEETSPYKYIGWFDCSKTFFSSCRPQMFQLNTKVSLGGGNDNDANKGKYSQTSKGPYTDIPSYVTPPTFRVVLGGGEDSTYDLMWDLDISKMEGHRVRALIKNFSTIIADPSTSQIVSLVKERELKGFNSDIASLMSLMQLVEYNYVTKHDGKKLPYIRTANQILASNIHKHADLVKKIHEARVQIRHFLYDHHVGKGFPILRENPEELETLKSIGHFKDIVERLEGLENDLELIEKQDYEMEKELHSMGTDDTVSGNMLLSDIFLEPGWRYQGFAKPQNVLELEKQNWQDSLLFYGFGTCAYEMAVWNINFGANEEATMEEIEKLIDFYLKLLRVHCTPEAKRYIIYLIDAGFLKRNAYFFEVPRKLSILQTPKISSNDLRMLSAALEFSIFTRTYQNLLKMEAIPKSRRTTNIPLINIPNASRTLDFILHFTALFVKRARGDVDTHFIKMCRNLVITLKGFMTRLIQDQEILNIHCENGLSKNICETELKANYGNRLAVNTAIQWVLHGLAPIELNGYVNTEKNFKEFYKSNKQSIRLGLKYYELD